jgi:hypothetical protein
MQAGIRGRNFYISRGQSRLQVSAIEIAVNHLLDIGMPDSVLPYEMFIIDSDK